MDDGTGAVADGEGKEGEGGKIGMDTSVGQRPAVPGGHRWRGGEGSSELTTVLLVCLVYRLCLELSCRSVTLICQQM